MIPLHRHPEFKYTSTLISFALLCVIFGFSLQAGDESSLQSGFFVNIVVYIFNLLSIPTTGYPLAFYVRKFAHFSEYFVFGFTLPQTKKETNFTQLHFFMFMIPIMDECIQLFVPGRVASPVDMLIDGFGLICGYSLRLFILNKKPEAH